MASNFIVARGTKAKYDAISSKSSNTLYFVDNSEIYLGEELLCNYVKDVTLSGKVLTITKVDGTETTLDLTSQFNSKVSGVAYTPKASSENNNPVLTTLTMDSNQIINLDPIIDPIETDISDLSAGLGELSDSLGSLRDEFDTLVDGGTEDVIDTFNEIKDFLAGFDDSDDTLSSLISTTEGKITTAVDDAKEVLIGESTDNSDANTIYGAKKYADSMITANALAWVDLT